MQYTILFTLRQIFESRKHIVLSNVIICFEKKKETFKWSSANNEEKGKK